MRALNDTYGILTPRTEGEEGEERHYGDFKSPFALAGVEDAGVGAGVHAAEAAAAAAHDYE